VTRTRPRRTSLLAAVLVLSVLLPAGVGATPLAPVGPDLTGVTDTATATAIAIEGGVARAGVASVDASWHLGASGGQFSDTGFPVGPDMVDPHLHATRKQPTQEIASRILTRALLVEGADGHRVAVVANDLYLPNDLLNRRVGQLLELHDAEVAAGLREGPTVGVTDETVAVTVSHNHNSPFYSTPGWGTWIFQDVVDVRFFDYYAEAMAQAVIDAAADLRPVRMGAATVPFNEISSHTYGPKVALDGTPAGQPYSHTTGQLSVVRFDDVSDPADPDPYAAWVIMGVHPEWTWGYDIFTGDITHAVMRILDRELGLTTVMSQRETGSSGPHKDERVHESHERREYQDNGFETIDHAARLWADAVIGAFADIEAATRTASFDPASPRTDGPPIALVPLSEGFTVASASERFAPPSARPVPGVSNCNTSQLFHGNPQAPILGFPDCENGGLDEYGGQVVDATPVDEPALYDQLKAAGVPIPDSYSATALTAVEETAAVHVMAMRLGDLGVTFCPCEQFTDTALNVQTRLDRLEGNLWRGWDWTSQTTPAGRAWCVPTDGQEGMTTCADPRNPAADLPPVPDRDVELMLAQVNNDAAGWETDVLSLFGESEAWDPAEVYGNFTHVEQTAHGYGMVVSVGMANDYFGYVPEYREMRAHEHYRKALNGLGLHGADYLANRMVALGAAINGGPAVQLSPQDLAYQAESGRALAVSTALGQIADAYTAVYEAALPADGGTPAILTQPGDIERFDAATLSWVGGSNYTDMPQVVVQRLEDEGWVTVGDMQGEVQARLEFPTPADLPAVESGTYEWVWHAQAEAYAGDVALPEVDGTRITATPPGTYRFVVDGQRRTGPGPDAVEAYHLESEPYVVTPFDGITATLAEAEGGAVEVAVGPTTTQAFDGTTYTFGPIDYPNSYDSPLAFVQGDQRRRFTYGPGEADDEFYCSFCRFHLWADTADAESVVVTVTRADGTVEHVPATPLGDGRWQAPAGLGAGDSAVVAAGGVVDRWGNTNGEASAPLAG
jgi:hypothetical protein